MQWPWFKIMQWPWFKIMQWPWGTSSRRRVPQKLAGLAYWKERAREYGPRAVLNLAHREEEIEAVTRYQMEAIFPLFIRSLRGDERIALDFGCGTGRFTPHLARLIGGKAIGIDPI